MSEDRPTKRPHSELTESEEAAPTIVQVVESAPVTPWPLSSLVTMNDFPSALTECVRDLPADTTPEMVAFAKLYLLSQMRSAPMTATKHGIAPTGFRPGKRMETGELETFSYGAGKEISVTSYNALAELVAGGYYVRAKLSTSFQYLQKAYVHEGKNLWGSRCFIKLPSPENQSCQYPVLLTFCLRLLLQVAPKISTVQAISSMIGALSTNLPGRAESLADCFREPARVLEALTAEIASVEAHADAGHRGWCKTLTGLRGALLSELPAREKFQALGQYLRSDPTSALKDRYATALNLPAPATKASISGYRLTDKSELTEVPLSAVNGEHSVLLMEAQVFTARQISEFLSQPDPKVVVVRDNLEGLHRFTRRGQDIIIYDVEPLTKLRLVKMPIEDMRSLAIEYQGYLQRRSVPAPQPVMPTAARSSSSSKGADEWDEV